MSRGKAIRHLILPSIAPAAMKWFRLETRAGEVARVSAMLVGRPPPVRG